MVEDARLYGGMALNIKNQKTQDLANKLAKLTGETLTTAVTTALKERLAKVEDTVPLSNRLMEIGEDCAARLGSARTLDPDALLYGNDGLPR